MNNKNEGKLSDIREQKKRLRDRIQKLNTDNQNTQAQEAQVPYQQNMLRLMEKKKKLQQEKQKKFNFMKMQEEYMNRRKQMEREKRMQQLKNEKRMIELEVGMKRMVFEGVKEKVKGMNSQQLMMRAMLRDQEGEPQKPYSSKGNVRRDFQKFLDTTQTREIKERWDMYQLNEKRMQIFEKKQEAVMRQVLLKSMLINGDEVEYDVMKLNRQELQQKLQDQGIHLEDYIMPIAKQQIIETVPELQRNAKRRIREHQQNLRKQLEEKKALQKYKAELKRSLEEDHGKQNVRICRALVYKIIGDAVLNYEKRVNRNSLSEIAQMKMELQRKYDDVLMQNQMLDLAQQVTISILQKIHAQFEEQTVQQIVKLHDFAHSKTQQSFNWLFGNGNVHRKLTDIEKIPIQLNFEDQVQKQQPIKKNQLKKEKHLSQYDDLTTNTFDVDKLTTELINQINLLQAQAAYFKRIMIKYHHEYNGPDLPFHILFDRQLYTVTTQQVSAAKKGKKYLGLNLSSKSLTRWIKFHNFWIFQDPNSISIFSQWGIEVLKSQIGQRMSNTCGKISNCQIYPITTLLGGICSLMIGFDKGQILKYNFNFNRLENSQINLSIYKPILPQIKNAEDPPFPLEKKNVIKVTKKKITQGSQLHEFRQFFDHHTTTIIAIKFYKYNSFISVDKSLKCAIWFYDTREGNKCYTPAYNFELVPSYEMYKQAQNPRFKNIFPGQKMSESPEKLYQKWMQNQTFLKRQIYNNPKKRTAWYKSPDWDDKQTQFPVWKISYEGSKVTKIYESFYISMSGKLQGKNAKIWRNYLVVLCEKEHLIRQDLKTIKIYSWNIEQKKMQTIGLQFDMFKNQAVDQFQILDSMLSGVDLHLLAVVSSGRILVFSLISGQLLRNLSDPNYLQDPKYSKYFFTEITSSRSYLAAATKYATMEISFNDQNNAEQQKELNDIIRETQRKYISLI